MVRQINNRHIQAVMNNLKLIILDYLAAKKSGVLDWCIYFLLNWKVTPSKHLTEYNTLRGNALHFTPKLNTNQYTKTLVRRDAFSDTFNVMSYARVWRNNRLYY